MAASLPLTGGRQCGAVRCEIAQAPLMTYCCHCTHCQQVSASAFSISVIVAEASVAYTAGTPRKTTWTSHAGNERCGDFCGECGVRLLHGRPPSSGSLSLRGGTLDDLSLARPAGHSWTKSAQAWVRFDPHDSLCAAQPTEYEPYIERFKTFGIF